MTATGEADVQPAVGAGFSVARVASGAVQASVANIVSLVVIGVILIGLPEAGAAWLREHIVVASDSGPTGLPNLNFIRSPVGSTVSILLGLAQVALDAVVRGAIVFLAFAALSGQQASLRQALRKGLANGWPFVLIIVCTMTLTFAGLFVLVAPGLMLITRWSVAGVSQVVERRGVFGSIGRSAELTRGHRWLIFGLFLIWVALLLLLEAPIGLLASPGGDPLEAALAPEWRVLWQPIFDAVFTPLYVVGATALYCELRRAREGIGAGAAELAAVFD